MSPRRTCIGCRAALSPDTGLRVTRAGDGSLTVGRTAPGRGAWLCRAIAPACARSAAKRRAWPRALRSEISPSAVEDLLRALEGSVPPGAGVGGEPAER